MLSRSVGMIAAVLVLSTACSKKDTASTTSTTGSAVSTAATATTAATAAKASTCVDGAYKDPSGTYCVKLPAGYTAPKATKKTNTGMEDDFESDDGFSFTVKYWTPSSSYAFTFEDIKKQDLEES